VNCVHSHWIVGQFHVNADMARVWMILAEMYASLKCLETSLETWLKLASNRVSSRVASALRQVTSQYKQVKSESLHSGAVPAKVGRLAALNWAQYRVMWWPTPLPIATCHSYPVYKIQPVWQRLYRVNKHPTSCQTSLTTGFTTVLNEQSLFVQLVV